MIPPTLLDCPVISQIYSYFIPSSKYSIFAYHPFMYGSVQVPIGKQSALMYMPDLNLPDLLSLLNLSKQAQAVHADLVSPLLVYFAKTHLSAPPTLTVDLTIPYLQSAHKASQAQGTPLLLTVPSLSAAVVASQSTLSHLAISRELLERASSAVNSPPSSGSHFCDTLLTSVLNAKPSSAFIRHVTPDLASLLTFLTKYNLVREPKRSISSISNSYFGCYKVYDRLASFQLWSSSAGPNPVVVTDDDALFVMITGNALDALRRPSNPLPAPPPLPPPPPQRALFVCLSLPSSQFVSGSVYSGVYPVVGHPPEVFVLESPSLESFTTSYTTALTSGLFTLTNTIDEAHANIDLLTRPIASLTTRGVTVEASYQYVPEGREGFGYCLQLSYDGRNSFQRVRLRSRHWVFTHADGGTNEVDGDGVIGYFPEFKADGSHDPCVSDEFTNTRVTHKFVYASCTGDAGVRSMEGHLSFVGMGDPESEQFDEFDVPIPKLTFSKTKSIFGF